MSLITKFDLSHLDESTQFLSLNHASSLTYKWPDPLDKIKVTKEEA